MHLKLSNELKRYAQTAKEMVWEKEDDMVYKKHYTGYMKS